MLLSGIRVGFALTGSFCTFEKTIPQISKLVEEGAEVLPIMSFNTYKTDTKFGTASEFIDKIEDITGKKIIHEIEEAEPIGPQNLTDVMVIAPCSGNTIREVSKWNNRYSCTYGCKISFKK